ncbi:Uncharacterized protein DBV15_12693 [Temnothorax longispinosus]|uniref:Caspase family p20 domain-containing protein n=1 Tax=Temnothorax longispinosus TaxID=300112 RepID=A0A4V3SCJ2_9HYME|nr:Uncharacterized protein DBV15_12693 [Temnothorax longispinosus]
MRHPKRGMAIIFNHTSYHNNFARPRPGTNIDCENLTDTLEKLEFQVTVFENYKHQKIEDELQKATETDHSENDCNLIATLTHGSYGELYAFDKFMKPISYAACGGNERDPGFDVDVEIDMEMDTISAKKFRIPIHADFLVIFSSVPGIVIPTSKKNKVVVLYLEKT